MTSSKLNLLQRHNTISAGDRVQLMLRPIVSGNVPSNKVSPAPSSSFLQAHSSLHSLTPSQLAPVDIDDLSSMHKKKFSLGETASTSSDDRHAFKLVDPSKTVAKKSFSGVTPTPATTETITKPSVEFQQQVKKASIAAAIEQELRRASELTKMTDTRPYQAIDNRPNLPSTSKTKQPTDIVSDPESRRQTLTSVTFSSRETMNTAGSDPEKRDSLLRKRRSIGEGLTSDTPTDYSSSEMDVASKYANAIAAVARQYEELQGKYKQQHRSLVYGGAKGLAAVDSHDVARLKKHAKSDRQHQKSTKHSSPSDSPRHSLFSEYGRDKRRFTRFNLDNLDLLEKSSRKSLDDASDGAVTDEKLSPVPEREGSTSRSSKNFSRNHVVMAHPSDLSQDRRPVASLAKRLSDPGLQKHLMTPPSRLTAKRDSVGRSERHTDV